jgi:hypothetical protein
MGGRVERMPSSEARVSASEVAKWLSCVSVFYANVGIVGGRGRWMGTYPSAAKMRDLDTTSDVR